MIKSRIFLDGEEGGRRKLDDGKSFVFFSERKEERETQKLKK